MELPNDSTIASMPLHTLTARYGSEGLEHRFDIETARYPTLEQERLLGTKALAMELHAGDQRALEPYVNHILRVGIRITSPHHYYVSEADIVIGGLLHDAVEDHAADIAPGEADRTHAQLTADALAVLGTSYGQRVAAMVAAVTNPEFDKSGDWQEVYRQHAHDAMKQNPDARVVKVSDFTDNGVGVLYSSASRLPHFAAKYRRMIPVFRELIPLADTPLSDNAKTLILKQVSEAELTFNTILSAA